MHGAEIDLARGRRRLGEAHDSWARSDGIEGESQVQVFMDGTDSGLLGLNRAELVAINASFPNVSLRAAVTGGD